MPRDYAAAAAEWLRRKDLLRPGLLIAAEPASTKRPQARGSLRDRCVQPFVPLLLCGFATSLAHCECVWSKMCFDSGCPLPEASNRALGEPRNWDLNREPFRPSSAQRSGLALRLLQRPRAPTRHCSCFRSSASMRAWSVPGRRSDSVAAVNSSFGIRLPRSKIVARSAR